jgi:hypothetical protein
MMSEEVSTHSRNKLHKRAKKEAVTEKTTEENKKLIPDLHSKKYEAKKSKMKGKEMVIMGGPENVSPIE